MEYLCVRGGTAKLKCVSVIVCGHFIVSIVTFLIQRISTSYYPFRES